MEKVLNELDKTWAAMEFEKDKHPRTGIAVLRITDEAIEALETNQVQLQNMLTSKFIGFFLEIVSGWQKRLATAGIHLQNYTSSILLAYSFSLNYL